MRSFFATLFLLAPVVLGAQESTSARAPGPPPAIEWQYGVHTDVAYLGDLNSPANQLFRSRGTTPKVDEVIVNMAGVYVRKKPSEQSRWGLEFGAHTGEDAKLFGFSATAPNMSGASWMLHLPPTNISYLLPVGSGLTVQGGIFGSFIGYDGLYAKDNLSYTRPWTADFTPYYMLGVNASYGVTSKTTVAGFILNGYWHLAHANNVPSVGGQVAYKPSDPFTVKETVLYGPHQANTALRLWRFLSNTTIERKTDRLTTALDFHVASEQVDGTGSPRAWWVAGQLPAHLVIHGPWSVTVRPEFAYDSQGRWTTFRQTVTALTSTLEYRAHARGAQAIFRLEHRYDHSTGPDGGFFTDDPAAPGGLTPGQHLLIAAVMLTYDGSLRR